LRKASTTSCERPQHAVEAAELGTLAGDELRGPVDELVPVGRLLGQEEEQRGLEEALDPSADVPAAFVVTPAGSRAMSICKTHIDAERR